MTKSHRRRLPAQSFFKELCFVAAGGILRRQPKALQRFRRESWFRFGQQLMKVRVARNRDCLGHAKLAMPAWQPACLLAVTIKHRKRIMRASVSYGQEWFNQRAYRRVTLWRRPATGNASSFFIQ